MNVKVVNGCVTSEVEVREGSTAKEALKALKLSPEAVLIVKNGKLVTEDHLLEQGDEVRLLNVASGG